MTVVLAGNQNCGKSTLFNALTGKNQRTGNFPGVTVEQTRAAAKSDPELTIIDLPGLYSLNAFSPEERLSADYLSKRRADVIINVVDAGNLRRNLYLTLQLSLLGTPTVVALNMIDEVCASGTIIDCAKLSRALSMPVVPICALSGEGISELVRAARRASYVRPAGPVDFVSNRLDGNGGLYERFERIMDDDGVFERVVAARYDFIDRLCDEIVMRGGESPAQKRSRVIDRLSAGRFTAIPVFVIVTGLVFYISFSLVGGSLGSLAERAVAFVSGRARLAMMNGGVDDLLSGFICDGIIAGAGAAICFFPSVVSVLFLLSLLEDCGYMARAAYFFDRPLSRVGLSGGCVMPFVLALGCTAPAVVAARTVRSKSERIRAGALCGVLPCSAKFVVFSYICAEMFPRRAVLILIAIYALCVGCLVVTAALSGLLTKEKEPFVIELPVYRFPSAAHAFADVAAKIRGTASKIAVTVVSVSALVWLASNFGPDLAPAKTHESILAVISRYVLIALDPLGITDWRAAAALLCGAASKEAVVGCFGVLAPEGVVNLLSPPATMAFLSLAALSPPCAASAMQIKKELGATAYAVFALQLLLSYVTALVVYRLAVVFF